MSQGFVVRLRGLPWSTKPEQIKEFLRECSVPEGEDGIHFTFSRDGRPSGECFVELGGEDDVTNAIAQNNEHIGSRYIEVFRVDKSEMEWMIKRSTTTVVGSNTDAVVKLRGLPFGCTKEEIAHFFSGLEIVPNGIMLPADEQGRNSGEAFVQFASPDIAERSFEKDKERIGHRYIELFKSDLGEANQTCRKMRGGIRPLMGPPGMGGPMGPRPGPYDRQERFGGGMGMMGGGGGGGYGRGGRGGRNVKGFFEEEFEEFGFGGGNMRGGFNRRGGGPPMPPPMRGGRGGMGMGGGGMDRRNMQPGSHYVSKTGHSVHMRGLPFQAMEQDVFDFFSPIQPVRCEFDYGDNGRPSGEANVDFATHQEAVEAMQKHKCNMQHRYIELFLNSEPNVPSGSTRGGGGGYGNNMGGGGGGFSNNGMSDNGYNDDMVPGFGQGGGGGGGSNNTGFSQGGGYAGNNQGFGGNQGGGFGNQGGFGSGGGGFGNQGGGYNNMGGGGGGYEGGMGSGGGMMGSNYTAF